MTFWKNVNGEWLGGQKKPNLVNVVCERKVVCKIRKLVKTSSMAISTYIVDNIFDPP